MVNLCQLLNFAIFVWHLYKRNNNWFLAFRNIKPAAFEGWHSGLQHNLAAFFVELLRTKTKIFVWIHVFFHPFQTKGTCSVKRLYSQLLFCFFSFTRNQNWLTAPLHCFAANAAFQVGKPYLHPKAWSAFCKSAHTVGLIHFMGFYAPGVHCGIMQSDLLHVKSYTFEGFWDFVFLRMLCSACAFTWKHVTVRACLLTRPFHQQLIQDWP